MWAFDGSIDVESDVQVALELRQEVSEVAKDAEKVACIAGGSERFKTECAKLRELCACVQDCRVLHSLRS